MGVRWSSMKNIILVATGIGVVLAAGAFGAFMFVQTTKAPIEDATTSESTSFTYVTSASETTAYCDGTIMDSAGYRATLTEVHTGTVAKKQASVEDVIRATLDVSTTGMCQTAMKQTQVRIADGVVTISPIEGWAGISISMCSCKPQVEVNLLRIAGVKQVVWVSF